MTVEMPGVKLPLILLAMSLTASPALAQTLPWPSNPPQPQAQTAPWPTTAAPPAAAPMAAPPGAAPPVAAPRPMVGAPGQPPDDCMPKFTELRTTVEKLRDRVDKIAAASRSQGDNKASREDVCKAITTYAAAEAKWAKFTVDNTTRCGIPADFGKQLTAANAKSNEVRKKVCAAGPAARPAAPSLSDALGTSRQAPVADSQTRSGTFNTLTGSAIAR